MRLSRAAILLAALFFVAAAATAGAGIAATNPAASAPKSAAPPLRVLFVGNSLTYYNNLPALTAAAYSSAVQKGGMRVEMLAQGGFLIREHLKAGYLQKLLDTKRFDVVVLQERGGLPFCVQSTDCDECSLYAQCLDSPGALREAIALVRAKGARPVLYGTWSGIPEQQAVLSDALKHIANDSGAALADVGTAMHQFAYHPDKPAVWDSTAHPTEIGSWLAAMMIVRAITAAPLPDVPPQQTCVPDWSHQKVSGDTLASSQPQPPSRCFTLTKTAFEQLRFESMRGDY